MMVVPDDLKPPNRQLLLKEFGCLLDVPRLWMSAPFLACAPRGDGHTVMVLPGLSVDDSSTFTIRRFLKYLGYDAHGWGQGRNVRGLRHYDEVLAKRLEEMYAHHNAPISLIGWSRGGILARELARNHPKQVRQVITLGSPFMNPLATNTNLLKQWFGGNYPIFATEVSKLSEAQQDRVVKMRQPLPMPATAVYTRSDGVAAWQSCLEPDSAKTENIEVLTTHAGLVFHSSVLWAIADRLAQPINKWRRFRPPRVAKTLYPHFG
ncbi:MAG: alpha/beta fold hydrolase [Pseudomonadota bacterium]